MLESLLAKSNIIRFSVIWCFGVLVAKKKSPLLDAIDSKKLFGF